MAKFNINTIKMHGDSSGKRGADGARWRGYSEKYVAACCTSRVVADRSGRQIIGGGHRRIRNVSGAGNGIGGGQRRDFRRRGHCRVGGGDGTCRIPREGNGGEDG